MSSRCRRWTTSTDGSSSWLFTVDHRPSPGVTGPARRATPTARGWSTRGLSLHVSALRGRNIRPRRGIATNPPGGGIIFRRAASRSTGGDVREGGGMLPRAVPAPISRASRANGPAPADLVPAAPALVAHPGHEFRMHVLRLPRPRRGALDLNLRRSRRGRRGIAFVSRSTNMRSGVDAEVPDLSGGRAANDHRRQAGQAARRAKGSEGMRSRRAPGTARRVEATTPAACSVGDSIPSAGRVQPHRKLKAKSSATTTGTGFPFLRPGLKRHCFATLTASSSRPYFARR